MSAHEIVYRASRELCISPQHGDKNIVFVVFIGQDLRARSRSDFRRDLIRRQIEILTDGFYSSGMRLGKS